MQLIDGTGAAAAPAVQELEVAYDDSLRELRAEYSRALAGYKQRMAAEVMAKVQTQRMARAQAAASAANAATVSTRVVGFRERGVNTQS